MLDLGHWTCEEKWDELPFGFVYLITNTVSGMKYIGKKQIERKTRRKPLKGKKRKRIFIGESDWKTYTGSSDRLNADIKKLGKKKFKFEIIRSCGAKSELAYIETLYQFQAEALFSEEYYNGIMNIRIGKVKFTKRPPKLLLS
jgi:hypothetical protein|tara:strand:+ start:60 stop:488 length:429 start_codon:yes stop_codon:yes gene_type:complete